MSYAQGLIDEADLVIRQVLIAEMAAAGESQVTMAELLGVSASAINRRFNVRPNYDWSLAELLVLGEWLDCDLVGLCTKAIKRARLKKAG